MTDQYAVIGNPVAHSKSPLIHAEFARQTGHDLSYVALFAPLDRFEAVVEEFRSRGGRGANVTLPFKHRAHALAAERTPRAEQAGAVNTLSFSTAGVAGDNTDGVGLVRDITTNLGFTVRGRRILIMGAGGAAYGACGPLLDEVPAALTIANRTMDKARALRDHLSSVHARGGMANALGYSELTGLEFDIVINATSAGLHDTMPLLPGGVFATGALAYDMVYDDTPFLEFARAEGARAVDGLGLLVEQAAESYRVWRGVRPQTAALIAQLRAGR